MQSQEITPIVRKAIRDWYKATGMTQRQLGDLIGVNNSNVNNWLNGVAKKIRPSNWENLYPLIQKYLPSDFAATADKLPPAVTARRTALKVTGLLADLHRIWPSLSMSEQALVVAYAAEMLEKQGHPIQPKVLDSKQGIA